MVQNTIYIVRHTGRTTLRKGHANARLIEHIMDGDGRFDADRVAVIEEDPGAKFRRKRAVAEVDEVYYSSGVRLSFESFIVV